MKPGWAFVMLVALVAMGYGVYKAKYEVRELKEQSERLMAEIRDHEKAIEVLRVEWAYLTRPTRLESLGKRHLELGAVVPSQIVPVQDIETALAPEGAVSGAPGGALASVRSSGQ